MRKKPVDPLPDVFVSTRATSRRVSDAVAAGRARKIAPRLYASNLSDDPATIIRRNLWRVISLIAPGTVVSHRTAIEMRPADDDSIFLTTTYERRVALPGVTLRFVRGPGPLEGDSPLWDVHIASRARALLETLQPSRAREGVARGLTRAQIEEVLERELTTGGETKLNRLRDHARAIAPPLNAENELEILQGIIGTLLGSRRMPLASPIAAARATSEPYDAVRLERLQTLFATLKTRPVASRPDLSAATADFANVAFFDAYFSNFIEGTRFRVTEAHEIIFDGKIPGARPADAHDVLGTYHLVGDRAFMHRGVRDFATFDDFVTALRAAHGELLSARLEKRPGEFKTIPNMAGDTTFVDPSLVLGTLRNGVALVRALEEPFHRAIAMMFLLAEVHPFDDGNGRIARAFMNAELVSGGERRILIPIVFRDEYLTGLRVLTRQGHPVPLIEILDFAHRYTSSIDFSDYDRAVVTLRETNAFAEPGSEVKLKMPSVV